jgi:O-antigen/teichoic acid export membrane protein
VSANAPSDAPAVEARPPSLRKNFAWTIAGNTVYGASQWAILSLTAKLGGGEMLGQYALAVAVAMPAAMLSHLNLRAVLATDIERRHPFHDYLAVRLYATALSLAAIAAIAFLSGYRGTVAAVIVLMGISLGAENVSDAHFGLMQRRERMDQIARSMIARGALSVVALGCTLWFTRSLLWAVAALVLSRIAILAAFDRPRASSGERLRGTGLHAQWNIFRTALPLGVVLMLVSLTANVPRYAIESTLGTRELGAFAAVASFVTAGATIVNALGQSATPRLARYFSEGDRKRFRALSLRLLGLALGLGLSGVAGASLAGGFILSAMYRPEYAAYSRLFVAVMAAGVFTYIGTTLGYIMTSARAFAPQMPLLAAVAATSAAASWMLIPVIGLPGAAAAIALAACVQIGGALLILAHTAGRPEPAGAPA